MTASTVPQTHPTDHDQAPETRFKWNRFSLPQLVVLAAATAPLVLIAVAVTARLLGMIGTETMIVLALEGGEDPGMLVFAAMLLASPVQWLTGRSQVRVRKTLGILFFFYALSNLAMFVIERGWADTVSEPFLVAGLVAFSLCVPLFATSSRRAQRFMGMARWRLLHKLTYVVALALGAHLALVGLESIGAPLIVVAMVLRAPPIQRWLKAAEPVALTFPYRRGQA